MTDASEQHYIDVAYRLAVAEELGTAEPLTIKMGPYTTFTVVGLLQLACRHPGLSPQLRTICHDVGRGLQSRFGGEAAQLLEQGWHHSHDVPPAGRPASDA